MDNYLPLSYLNAWEYCPRRFYLEYELGEMEDNEHILLGRFLHENVDEPGTNQTGDTLNHRSQWVWSDRLEVKGIIDLVEEQNQQLVPVEFKKGKMARHLNDHFQLCAAGICLEERLGKTIDYGEIFYHGNRRRQRVEFTSQLRQATEAAIQAAQFAATQKIPAPLMNSKKCQSCSLRVICLPFEVKFLHENLNAVSY